MGKVESLGRGRVGDGERRSQATSQGAMSDLREAGKGFRESYPYKFGGLVAFAAEPLQGWEASVRLRMLADEAEASHVLFCHALESREEITRAAMEGVQLGVWEFLVREIAPLPQKKITIQAGEMWQYAEWVMGYTKTGKGSPQWQGMYSHVHELANAEFGPMFAWMWAQYAQNYRCWSDRMGAYNLYMAKQHRPEMEHQWGQLWA